MAYITASPPTVLLYCLELAALRRLHEAVFGVLMSLDTVVAALAGFVVLHHDLVVRQMLAIAMVVAAATGGGHRQPPVTVESWGYP